MSNNIILIFVFYINIHYIIGGKNNMKMSRNYKKLCLILGLSGIVGAGTVTAAQATRSLQATYRDIQVTYNGVSQNIAQEPFSVDGSVYVPLRAISDILGVQAQWQPTTNTVALSGGSASNDAEIAQLNYQIATLTQELNAARTELAQYKANNNTNNSTTNTSGSNITNEQLKNTEDYLNSNFSDYFNNITMDYALSNTSNQINVVISYDTRSENTSYEKLSTSKIEAFMKKIGDNIAATHSDITISGTIEYTNDNAEKATFTRNKNGKYTYTHAFDEDTLIEAMKDETNDVFNIEYLSDFDSLDIIDYKVDIRESKSTINAKIYLETNDDFKTAWNKLPSSKREDAIFEQLSDIQDTLSDVATGYEDITITVYYGKSSNKIGVMDADGDVKESSL